MTGTWDGRVLWPEFQTVDWRSDLFSESCDGRNLDRPALAPRLTDAASWPDSSLMLGTRCRATYTLSIVLAMRHFSVTDRDSC
jgi:hypothetical protein